MDGNTLRAIADAERERQRVDLIKQRANSFAIAYNAAKSVMEYAEYATRKKLDGDWLEFRPPFRDIMYMRWLGTWCLGPRGYQGQNTLTLFTGRVIIESANSVNHARVRVRYQ